LKKGHTHQKASSESVIDTIKMSDKIIKLPVTSYNPTILMKTKLLRTRKKTLLHRIQIKTLLLTLLLFLFLAEGYTQTVGDSSRKKELTFSGSLGLSSNGFSIVPSFSLNSPATMTLLSWRKNKFSIEPDIRLTLNARKGSMILWFRYHAIQTQKYKLRVGAHPAMNFQLREIDNNGNASTISQMRRFFAWEVSNDYKINHYVSAGIYYLQGNGLQKDGPRTTHFVALNTSVANLKLSKALRLAVAPTIYYLKLDNSEGKYISGAVILSHTKLPFTLQHAFNKTFVSNLAGNRDYMWNVSVHYNFKKTYRRV
jgi:hypothetical protein